MEITTKQYFEYIECVAAEIASQGDYITELDAKTVDGDHWLNLNNGYKKLLEKKHILTEKSTFKEFFMQLARSIMSDMGGTSGALYGSMYLAAAKCVGSVEVLNMTDISELLNCWVEAIMHRGNTQPGQKTMLDAVYPAAQAFGIVLKDKKPESEMLDILASAAWQGAESTKDMEARRGRASNQPRKGIGSLDPGAVTMAIQLECLAKYLRTLI